MNSLCMWNTTNVGTCLQAARILEGVPPSSEWTKVCGTWKTSVDDVDISIRKVKGVPLTTIEIDEDHVIRIRCPSLRGVDEDDPAHHASALSRLLGASTIWSQEEPDIPGLEETDRASDVIMIAGGAIAREMDVDNVTLCTSSPWSGGQVLVGNEHRPIPEEWSKTLGIVLPGLYACSNEVVQTVGDVISLGPHWQLCHRNDDAIAEMRLHAQAADRKAE